MKIKNTYQHRIIEPLKKSEREGDKYWKDNKNALKNKKKSKDTN
jgi:hypothetical protein